MRKINLTLILLSFLYSCTSNIVDNEIENEEAHSVFCVNELKLLKSDSQNKIQFDFDFDFRNKDGLEYIQSQTNVDLCNDRNEFSTTFYISNNDSIESSLITEKYCEGNYSHPIRSTSVIEVLINKNSQLLLEGEYVKSIDSLQNKVNQISQKEIAEGFFPNNGGKALYMIEWDDETPLEDRVEVFEAIVKGYLITANQISIKKFKKEICSLNPEELIELKKCFRFILILKEMIIPIIENNKGVYDCETFDEEIPSLND